MNNGPRREQFLRFGVGQCIIPLIPASALQKEPVDVAARRRFTRQLVRFLPQEFMTELDRIHRYLFLARVVLHVRRHEPAAVSRDAGRLPGIVATRDDAWWSFFLI